jgi:hypothetical protein
MGIDIVTTADYFSLGQVHSLLAGHAQYTPPCPAGKSNLSAYAAAFKCIPTSAAESLCYG